MNPFLAQLYKFFRKHSPVWLSHLLFIPSIQLGGMHSYSQKNSKEEVEAKAKSNKQMAHFIPKKYRNQVVYLYIPAGYVANDPLPQLGYFGWKYNPKKRI